MIYKSLWLPDNPAWDRIWHTHTGIDSRRARFAYVYMRQIRVAFFRIKIPGGSLVLQEYNRI